MSGFHEKPQLCNRCYQGLTSTVRDTFLEGFSEEQPQELSLHRQFHLNARPSSGSSRFEALKPSDGES